MSLKRTKEALYAAVVSDAPLMAKLGNVPPFHSRLPKKSKHGETFVAMTWEGETAISIEGHHEDQTVSFHVWSYDHDKAQDVVEDLRRLFHSKLWKLLSVGAPAKALSKVEAELDLVDLDSELIHKVVRLRIRYADS